MKKVIISLFIVTILVLVNKNDTKVLIPDNAIRFRIIANSNSIEDQKEKIEIRSLKRGECLMYVGESHILTKVEASEEERKIIE